MSDHCGMWWRLRIVSLVSVSENALQTYRSCLNLGRMEAYSS